MDFKEEQQQEIEALGFIYQPEELEIHSESELTVNLPLDDPDIIPLEEVEWFVSLWIKFPDNYPEAIPEYTISSEYLLDSEIDELSVGLNEQCTQNIGLQMVFLMTSWLKENAEIIIKARVEEESEDEQAAIEEIVKVTRESFIEWQTKFLQEAMDTRKAGQPLCLAMQAALAIQERNNISGKLTGRQMFEKDSMLLKSDEQYTDGDVVNVVELVIQDEEEEQEALVFTDE